MDLIDAFEARIGCALPASDDLRRRLRQRTVRRGDALFRAGEPETRIHYIASGVIKLSFVSDEGLERIRDFVADGRVFACLESLDGSMPALFSAIACENAVVDSLEYQLLAEYTARYPLWMQCLSLFLLDTAKNRGERERRFLMLPPPQRFAQAIEDRPWLLQRVSQQDLAAYIGVTPVSLSRLKAREARRRRSMPA